MLVPYLVNRIGYNFRLGLRIRFPSMQSGDIDGISMMPFVGNISYSDNRAGNNVNRITYYVQDYGNGYVDFFLESTGASTPMLLRGFFFTQYEN